ncbi:MAG: O-antigen ligase family protein [Candidatus Jordarchaeaceae archaeon]
MSGIIISPFVFWPWAEVEFEIPKVWFTNRWIEILAIFGIITSPLILKKERFDITLVAIVFAFFFQTILSSILGVDLDKSLAGNYFRADGIFTLLHLIILFLVITIFISKKLIRQTIIFFTYSSLLLSIWATINAAFYFVIHKPIIPAWDGAIGINFGNPNFLAGYLVVTLPFLSYLTDTKILTKKLAFVSFSIQLSAILLTLSKSGVLMIFIFFFLWSLLIKRRFWLSIFLFLLAYLFLFIFSIQFFKPADPNNPTLVVAEGRERIIRKGLTAFTKRPVWGWGWSNFDYAFESVDWPVKFVNDVYVDKAHSHFLEILVTTGLFGLFLYLAIVLKVISNLIRKEGTDKYLLLAFLLFIAHSQTNIISISEEIIFWIIASFSGKSGSLG